jgi:rare lipoprotein A
MVRFLSCLAVVAMLVLVGCQQVLHPNFPEYKGYKKAPYTVKGTRFVPMSVESALHYKATGIASHYEADGAIGAIGQNLYRHQRYAAHRTLPLPCTVRITCHRTGKTPQRPAHRAEGIAAAQFQRLTGDQRYDHL